MTTTRSLGSVLLNEALNDPAKKQALHEVAHRTQLWTYRTGRAKPTVDRAAEIAAACPSIPAEAWGKPAPEQDNDATKAAS